MKHYKLIGEVRGRGLIMINGVVTLDVDEDESILIVNDQCFKFETPELAVTAYNEIYSYLIKL